MDPATIVSLVSVLIALGSLFVAWRKVGPESRKLEAEARKANSERKNLDVDSLCDTVVALDNEIKRLRAEMAQERQETAALITALRQDLDRAISELARAQVQIEADAARIGELEADNARLKRALDGALATARQFKADLDKARQQIGILEQKLAEAQAQIRERNGRSCDDCNG